MSAINFDREKARRLDQRIAALRHRQLIARCKVVGDPEAIADVNELESEIERLEQAKTAGASE